MKYLIIISKIIIINCDKIQNMEAGQPIQLTPEQIQERAAALMPELAALVEPIEGAEGDS